jgi:hypothetical protein
MLREYMDFPAAALDHFFPFPLHLSAGSVPESVKFRLRPGCCLSNLPIGRSCWSLDRQGIFGNLYALPFHHVLTVVARSWRRVL